MVPLERIQINVILLLQSQSVNRSRSRGVVQDSFENPSDSLIESLWAAIKEVEAFYNKDILRAEYRHYFCSERLPTTVQRETSDPRVQGSLCNAIQDELFSRESPRKREPLRQNKVGERTLNVLNSFDNKGTQLILTNREITPPNSFRYILADDIPGGAIVSFAPMDPSYWGLEHSDPLSIIRHRVRTMCLAAVGELLGFERCDNDKCFLYSDIDSVTRLDEMVLFGPEHDVKGLTNYGYSYRPFPKYPARVQQIEKIS